MSGNYEWQNATPKIKKKTFFKIKANLAHKSHFTLQSFGMPQSMFNLVAGVPRFYELFRLLEPIRLFPLWYFYENRSLTLAEVLETIDLTTKFKPTSCRV